MSEPAVLHLPDWKNIFSLTLRIFGPAKLGRRGFLAGSSAAALVALQARADEPGYTQATIFERDFAARQASALVQLTGNTTAQRPYQTIFSLIVGTGQSNLQGDQNAWAGAAPTMYGNVMLGEGTRPILARPLSNPNIILFQPVGGTNTIEPLVSMNQSNLDGTAVTVNQGGFDSVTGASFAISPRSVLTLTAPTGTMHQLVNGVLTATPVGGPGQPAFDLTMIFAPGMGVWVTNVTGNLAAEAVNEQALMNVATVTPTTLVITSGDGFGYTGVSSTPISISVTNNFGAFGEDACVTQANDYAALSNAAGTLPPDKSWGVINAALAGVTVAQLSPGASPDLYNRAIDGVTRFAAAAASQGQSTSVVADIYEQGAADIVGGTDTSQAAYTASLLSIYNAHRAAYPGITGQTRPPVFMISQTSGFDLANSDYGNDAVSMAQLLFCTSGQNPDAYCFGPTYHAPNQGAHETPNGQRWKGAMRAKILYRILALNQGWLPLYPISITYNGGQILMAFHVPAGRLQFRPSYKFCTPTVYPDAGFQATDASGLNPVKNVTIGGTGATVIINFERNFVSAPQVQYADAANHSGIGNLYDGDVAVSAEVYSFVPFSGQPPIENIPAFTDTVLTGRTFASPVGQPYALFNPCCVFNLPAVQG